MGEGQGECSRNSGPLLIPAILRVSEKTSSRQLVNSPKFGRQRPRRHNSPDERLTPAPLSKAFHATPLLPPTLLPLSCSGARAALREFGRWYA
jgi:hypothetical protein